MSNIILFNNRLVDMDNAPYISSIDADALAFLNAAGITDSTQMSAINTLVIGLKSANIWTKMKAIYPFIGGTASTHKWNLKDPRDLDAAFRLFFYGGGTHSSTGYQPNGSNAYASTFLIPSSNYPTTWDVSIGFYSRTNNAAIANDIGVYQSATQALAIQTRWTDNKIYSQSFRDSSPYNIVVTNTDSSGLFVLTRTSTTLLKQFRNTTLLGSNTTAIGGTIPTNAIVLSNNSQSGAWSSRELAFAFIGNGLTDTDVSNLYALVQAYQTSLSRQI